MSHPTRVSFTNDDGDPYQSVDPAYAGDHLGFLRYDALQELVAALAERVARDAEADRERGRTKLAMCLAVVAGGLTMAAAALEAAWEICEPHKETW